MTFLEAKKHLCNRKLNSDYTDIANNDLFSDTDLGVWVRQAIAKAWDLHPWDFAEEISTGSTSGGTITYPDTFMTGSIFLLRINGKEYKNVNQGLKTKIK